jgi:hypothetical protein
MRGATCPARGALTAQTAPRTQALGFALFENGAAAGAALRSIHNLV